MCVQLPTYSAVLPFFRISHPVHMYICVCAVTPHEYTHTVTASTLRGMPWSVVRFQCAYVFLRSGITLSCLSLYCLYLSCPLSWKTNDETYFPSSSAGYSPPVPRLIWRTKIWGLRRSRRYIITIESWKRVNPKFVDGEKYEL